jgi:hypothetical protein
VFNEVLTASVWASLGGTGNWNDDDILEVGNPGLTIAEQRTHFALWCMVKSPLLVGCDVRSIANDSLALMKNKELIAINQDPLGVQAELKAVYNGTAWTNIYKESAQSVHTPQLLSVREKRAVEVAKQEAFDTNSSFMTTCDYIEGPAPSAQRWHFVSAAGGSTRIQSSDGASCLSNVVPGIVPCAACSTDCGWDTNSGYSGENGNKGKANETTAQIKSKVDGKCLKFSAASRGGKGLYMETCNTDPVNCITKRCYYSESLGDEEW